MIYHIAEPEAWTRARAEGAYHAASLEREGFIHASTAAQVLDTAARYYEGRRDLILLRVDPSLVAAEIRWEIATAGERFPHVFGAIPLEAVTGHAAFSCDAAGRFAMPATWTEA